MLQYLYCTNTTTCKSFKSIISLVFSSTWTPYIILTDLFTTPSTSCHLYLAHFNFHKYAHSSAENLFILIILFETKLLCHIYFLSLLLSNSTAYKSQIWNSSFYSGQGFTVIMTLLRSHPWPFLSVNAKRKQIFTNIYISFRKVRGCLPDTRPNSRDFHENIWDQGISITWHRL